MEPGLILRRAIVAASVGLIAVGGIARFVHLGQAFYFHDEAATSLRVSGHTSGDFKRLAAGHTVTAAQIAPFQSVTDRGIGSTVHSLANEDPQHPPLFFVLARIWAGAVGSSVVDLRALAALCGLLFLAAGGWLVQVLFRSWTTTLVAVGLLAVSPFQLLYSGEAREYSLWLAAVAASAAALVTATRVPTWRSWIVYGVALAVALYSFPNTVLLLGGHAVYVLLVSRGTLTRFAVAAGAALASFLPWLAVIVLDRNALESGTNWTKASIPFGQLARSWLVVFGLGVVDHKGNQSSVHGATAVLSVAVLSLEVAALLYVWRRGPRDAWLLLSMLLLSAVAPLLVADVALGGIRSIIPRFVAPAYLVLTVSLAYLVSGVLRAHGAWMRAACACAGIVVVAAAAGSYGMRWGADVWWNQDDGAAAESSAVATLVNGLPRPQLISTGLGTLLELSHYLRPGTPIRVVVDGREPPLQRGQSYILYGSPASGAAAARLDRLLSDIRRRGDAKLELVSPQLPCCGAGIPTIPRQLWRVTPR